MTFIVNGNHFRENLLLALLAAKIRCYELNTLSIEKNGDCILANNFVELLIILSLQVCNDNDIIISNWSFKV